MSFTSLGLRAELLRALADAGYTTPTPVQAQAIPLILKGHDILAGAQTGTGKTAGFTLPLLQRLMTAKHEGGIAQDEKRSSVSGTSSRAIHPPSLRRRPVRT